MGEPQMTSSKFALLRTAKFDNLQQPDLPFELVVNPLVSAYQTLMGNIEPESQKVVAEAVGAFFSKLATAKIESLEHNVIVYTRATRSEVRRGIENADRELLTQVMIDKYKLANELQDPSEVVPSLRLKVAGFLATVLEGLDSLMLMGKTLEGFQKRYPAALNSLIGRKKNPGRPECRSSADEGYSS